MPALAQGNPPFGRLHIARVKRVGQNVIDELVSDIARSGIARESCMAFKEALDLGLYLEAPGGKAFQPLLNDGGQRFLAHQQLAFARRCLMAIARRTGKRPVAIGDPRPHTVAGLLGVLLPLVLRNTGEQVLDQDGIGILAKFYGRAFEASARFRNCAAQFQMCADIARQAGNIVNQDDIFCKGRLFAQIIQHGRHAGPVDHTAGDAIIGKYAVNGIALGAGKLLTARFLGLNAMPALHLRKAGNTAINDRLDFCLPCGFRFC